MGMHFGVIAAEAPLGELLAALSGTRGTFRAGRALGSLEELPEPGPGEDKAIVAGELDGRSYLLDESLLLAMTADPVVGASAALGAVVVGIGAETTSGMYFLAAARSGQLVRLHWDCLSAIDAPLNEGAPLAVEGRRPLDDVDGEGLTEALREFGFDLERWRTNGPFALVEAEWGDFASGPIDTRVGEYVKAHTPPHLENAFPKPEVINRGPGLFDLAASGSRLPDGNVVGRRAADVLPSKVGLFGRLLRRD